MRTAIRLLIATAAIVCQTTNCRAQKADKVQQRIAYIAKDAKLTKQELSKVKTILEAYIGDMHANKKRHDEVKDKYESAEDKGKLTDAQADELIQSKFIKDEKDLKIRRQYYPRLKALIGAKKAREVIKSSDDKIKAKK